MNGTSHYEELLCPECRQRLVWSDRSAECPACGRNYPIKGGIPILTGRPEYWCNVEREVMHRLISDARDTGDWFGAVRRHIPQCAAAVVPLYRADAQFLFTMDSSARVLDAGAMWGGVTVPVAQFCEEIYALDKTWETLRLLKIRAEQMKIKNIRPVVSGILKTPFPDGYFDFVILNGVLEWVGLEQDIVWERHKEERRQDEHTYKESPEKMQLRALGEILRVLKPGGGVYVAIENRVGLPYFLGHPDDHVNVRFVSLLPRALANLITKRLKNVEYRTYTYSPRGLAKIMERAGFYKAKIYSVHPHYIKISRITPFNIFNSVRKIATVGYAHIKVVAASLVWQMTPSFLTKHLSPSLAAVAQKPGGLGGSPRLLSILQAAGVIEKNDSGRYELAVMNSRYEDANPTNYLVFDRNSARVRFFCKVARGKDAAALEYEHEMIAHARRMLSQSRLSESIPNIVFSGEVDGISLQVNDYIEGRRKGKGVLDGFRRIENFVEPGRLPPLFLRPMKAMATRAWLKSVDMYMSQGIDFLARFQNATKVDTIGVKELKDKWLRRYLETIKSRGIRRRQTSPLNVSLLGVEWVNRPAEVVYDRDIDIDEEASRLFEQLSKIEDARIPVCMVHGDYDVCNLLFNKRGVSVVDFEHAEREGLPFFDLGNLIFSPLVMEWHRSDRSLPLEDYAARTGWNVYLKKWARRYCIVSKIPPILLSFLPSLAALGQNSKIFQDHRDPRDYPMYGKEELKEMLGWNLEI